MMFTRRTSTRTCAARPAQIAKRATKSTSARNGDRIRRRDYIAVSAMIDALMVTPDKFRQVMGNFATGITVVTTVDKSGKPYGLTVNSFTSVSLEPVLVLVCLDVRLSGLQAFKDSKHFGVSMLSEHQEDLSRIFAKKDAERPPAVFFEGKLGIPLLHNS